MKKYFLDFTDEAIKNIAKHKKSGNKVLMNKIAKILKELKTTPCTGIGKPEQLKHNLSGYWSRRLNREHRLIYIVEENIVTVTVISAMGHYEK